MRTRKQNTWNRINALLPDLKARKQNAWGRRNALLSDLREHQCGWVDDRKSRRSLEFNGESEVRVYLGIQECSLLGFSIGEFRSNRLKKAHMKRWTYPHDSPIKLTINFREQQ